MPITQKDLRQIAKALDPKFKEIDDRFVEMRLEIGDMFNDVHGDAAVFQSRTLQRFDDIDQRFDNLERILNTTLKDHDQRIAKLEKAA